MTRRAAGGHLLGRQTIVASFHRGRSSRWPTRRIRGATTRDPRPRDARPCAREALRARAPVARDRLLPTIAGTGVGTSVLAKLFVPHRHGWARPGHRCFRHDGRTRGAHTHRPRRGSGRDSVTAGFHGHGARSGETVARSQVQRDNAAMERAARRRCAALAAAYGGPASPARDRRPAATGTRSSSPRIRYDRGRDSREASRASRVAKRRTFDPPATGGGGGDTKARIPRSRPPRPLGSARSDRALGAPRDLPPTRYPTDAFILGSFVRRGCDAAGRGSGPGLRRARPARL